MYTVLEILKEVCRAILDDSSFHLQSEGNKVCLKMANDFLCIVDHPSDALLEFETWLCCKLNQVLDTSISTNPIVKIDREKMWALFHKMRANASFQQKWKQFLHVHSMPNEPLFYQHVTTKVFETILKRRCQLHTQSPFEEPAPVTQMTYEEENAVRYIGGYILRSLSTKAEKEKDSLLAEAIQDLKGDDNELPSESEEWTGSVDRGGLTYISDATHQFLSAVEYSLRRYLSTSTAHLMNDEFRSTLTKNVVDDDDVSFHWSIASASVEDDVVERLLEGVVKLYITVRGFSFAGSVLEMYKKEGKTATQKKKTLRQLTK